MTDKEQFTPILIIIVGAVLIALISKYRPMTASISPSDIFSGFMNTIGAQGQAAIILLIVITVIAMLVSWKGKGG